MVSTNYILLITCTLGIISNMNCCYIQLTEISFVKCFVFCKMFGCCQCHGTVYPVTFGPVTCDLCRAGTKIRHIWLDHHGERIPRLVHLIF